MAAIGGTKRKVDNNELKRKQKRDEDSLNFDKYMNCYGDLLDGLARLRDSLESGQTAEQALAKVKEIMICDEALWHMYSAEQKQMRKTHANQRARARKVQP